MASSQALNLATELIRNDVSNAPVLLRLLAISKESQSDPVCEVAIIETMLFLYSKTEDCETAMNRFICQHEKVQTAA